MNKLSIILMTTFVFLVLSTSAQSRVGDKGVEIDQELIAANADNYPQMERWAKAGVEGGIPELNDFVVFKVIQGGTHTTINNAISEVSSQLKSGELGLVLLKNGAYDLANRVIMESNVSLLGESRDGVVCTINFKERHGFLFGEGVKMAGLYRLTIQGGWGQPKYDWNYSIDQNDEMPDNDNISVQLKGASNCWLDKVNIYNSGRDPLRCNSSHITFRDLDVDGAHRKAGGAQGYFFIQNGDNLITGCRMTRLRHISLQGDNVEYNVVYDNDFHQEVSFHSGDDGNNLIANNRITLPADMPPVESGGPYPETNTNAPNYFAIMGPWSTQHTVSSNPNFLYRNTCLQLNHNYGSATPWSDDSRVYSGPLVIGREPNDHINNFPELEVGPPVGGKLYAIKGIDKSMGRIESKAPSIDFLKPFERHYVAGQSMFVELDVVDDHKVESVSLYLDDVLISTLNSAPYFWGTDIAAFQNLEIGTKTIKAVAVDDEGHETQKSLTIWINSASGAAAYTESFSNMALDGWGQETFQGDSWTWNVDAKGINGDIDGKGVYFHFGATGITSGVISGGIQSFSTEVVNKFSAEARTIELIINDQVIATKVQDGRDEVYTFTVNDINIEGDFVLSIKNATPESEVEKNGTISIDNISWASMGSRTNRLPMVIISNISEGQNFANGTSVPVIAEASDDSQVVSVSLSLDGELISTDTESPFSWDGSLAELANLSSGEHVLKAVALDDDGAEATAVRRFSVGANQAPSLQFVDPQDGAIIANEISSVEVNAEDDDQLVATNLYLDNELISTKTAAPFGWAKSETFTELSGLATGQYVLKATAEDNQGKKTTRSAAFFVDGAPVITIRSPFAGASLDNNPVLDIEITDVGNISKTELILNGQSISTRTEAPFGWTSSDVVEALVELDNDTYTLEVVAEDVDNNIAKEQVEFIISSVLSTSERGMIYPNPFGERLYIKNKNGLWKQARLLDLSGKELIKQSLHAGQCAMDLAVDVPFQGIFILELTNESKTSRHKVIKQK
ncbi:MAG: T9SS type A sorting domain-containing protein [Cyclobacteriaceae bacterium]